MFWWSSRSLAGFFFCSDVRNRKIRIFPSMWPNLWLGCSLFPFRLLDAFPPRLSYPLTPAGVIGAWNGHLERPVVLRVAIVFAWLFAPPPSFAPLGFYTCLSGPLGFTF